MPKPLTVGYWEALRRLAEPLELMKFTLTFDGDLPATGNSKKPGEVAVIRNQFHDQLADLWDRHIVLRKLERTARIPEIHEWTEVANDEELYKAAVEWPEHREPIPPLKPGQIDLCAPITKDREGQPTFVAYRPLIRESLGLACALDILFLRQEEPGSLVLQGGDLDNRIKTLFDALRMPTRVEEDSAGITATANPLQVLLQEDALISDVSIKTGRLLGARARKVHAVHLAIDVTVKVLRVIPLNIGLVGD